MEAGCPRQADEANVHDGHAGRNGAEDGRPAHGQRVEERRRHLEEADDNLQRRLLVVHELPDLLEAEQQRLLQGAAALWERRRRGRRPQAGSSLRVGGGSLRVLLTLGGREKRALLRCGSVVGSGATGAGPRPPLAPR